MELKLYCFVLDVWSCWTVIGAWRLVHVNCSGGGDGGNGDIGNGCRAAGENQTITETFHNPAWRPRDVIRAMSTRTHLSRKSVVDSGGRTHRVYHRADTTSSERSRNCAGWYENVCLKLKRYQDPSEVRTAKRSFRNPARDNGTHCRQIRSKTLGFF